MKNGILIYQPDMWARLFSGFKKHCKDKGTTIGFEALDVLKTSSKETLMGYAAKAVKAGKLPIFILPAAHCVRIINDTREDRKLCVLGPAVRTRNDIYAFRKKTRAPSSWHNTIPKTRLTIAVKERNITTTDISRLILRKWSPEVYLFSEFDPISLLSGRQESVPQDISENKRSFASLFCSTCVTHEVEKQPAARVAGLISDKFQVAIFMGKELEDQAVKTRLGSDLLESANLNQLIGNIYDTQLFPRAVYAMVRSHLDIPGAMDQVENFIKLANSYAEHVEKKEQRKLYTPWEQIQWPSKLDLQGDELEFEILLKFTADICATEHVSCFHDYENENDKKEFHATGGLKFDHFFRLPTKVQDRINSQYRACLNQLTATISKNGLAAQVGPAINTLPDFKTHKASLLALISQLSDEDAMLGTAVKKRITALALGEEIENAMHAFVDAQWPTDFETPVSQ